MSNYYGFAFSNTDPTQYPSLAPTFLTFRNALTGATLAQPSISQIDFTGVYGFTYAVTVPIYFRVDGITISSPTDRYVQGILDPSDSIDFTGTTLVALGNTSVAYGQTINAIGSTLIGYGTTNFALNTSIYAQTTTLSAIGLTNGAISSSLSALIGNTSSLFGDSSTDPTTVFGFLKRMQEFNEGDQTFSKTAGTWTIKDRTGATTIQTRTLDNTSTTVTRS